MTLSLFQCFFRKLTYSSGECLQGAHMESNHQSDSSNFRTWKSNVTLISVGLHQCQEQRATVFVFFLISSFPVFHHSKVQNFMKTCLFTLKTCHYQGIRCIFWNRILLIFLNLKYLKDHFLIFWVQTWNVLQFFRFS